MTLLLFLESDKPVHQTIQENSCSYRLQKCCDRQASTVKITKIIDSRYFVFRVYLPSYRLTENLNDNTTNYN